MRHLKLFTDFNMKAFLDGKEIVVSICRPWEEDKTKRFLGTRVESFISKDETKYVVSDGKPVLTNLHEKLVFKVPDKVIEIAPNTKIIPVNPKGSVYGDYNHLLSAYAEDIKVVEK